MGDAKPSINVHEVIDDSDGEVLRTTLSRDRAISWRDSHAKDYPDVSLSIRSTVRHDVGEKIAALAIHLDVDPAAIEEIQHRDNTFEVESEPGEYLVLTESEREQAADDMLESHIDDCIIDQAKTEAHGNCGLESLVDTLAQYFDRAAWKRDALISDGYGHTLSPYDGEEHEEKIDGAWYFIYRVD